MKPILAKPYNGTDPTGFLMSEKLDGIRAIWTGSALISRNGNTFHAPQWFIDALPAAVPLDGELYLARGAFQATASIIKKKTPIDSEWENIRFHVFDAPAEPDPFELRLAFCEFILRDSPVCCIVPHIPCESRAHMIAFFENICTAGGEGIMLRAPRSPYEQRRSSHLLKYKPFETDEAVMISTEPGGGKFATLAGALVVRWKKITFRIGSGIPDDIRRNPPKKGALITFQFCGLTDSGCPRFPAFIAERSYE